MKNILVAELIKIVDERCIEILNFKKDTYLTDDVIITQLYYNRDNGLVVAYENLKDSTSGDMDINELRFELIMKISNLMVTSTKPYYKWAFKCENEPFEETTDSFETANDAYENMKKAIMDRASSLTEKCEFYDVPSDGFLRMSMDFYHDEIILNGHGGKCVFKVFKIG